ncbi:MAG: hypothetical protein ACI837_001560 [Crocinitomicaceae bacterium]|jgi:hypothetical protein
MQLITPGILIVMAFFLLLALIAYSLFLVTLYKTLKRIAPENRLAEPGHTWLMFIPLFSLVWAFLFYPKLCDSIKNEFEARNEFDGSDYGRGIGYGTATVSVMAFVPVLGAFGALIAFTLFIVFWVKIASYNKILKRGRKKIVHIGKSSDLLDD